ncbi:MAG: NAD-dependent epimerase/dehydratase family protein [Nitrospinae bacterium]|nr:NAD-dependent epimerase/dehydratase family protein [Nitrospinota bacterium]
MNFDLLKEASVLVTGAGGFIGNHLTATLKNHGARVIAVDRTARDGISVADMTNVDEVKKCFRSSQEYFAKPIEYVFHLAGQNNAGIAHKFPFDTLQSSFQSAINILEVARNQPGIKNVIIPSTLGVYGRLDDQNEHALKESDRLVADSVYSATKITAEYAALSYVSEFGLPVRIARLANVYGPGQSNAAVIPSLISQMSNSQEISMGNMDAIRDFIYIDDVIEGLLAISLLDNQPQRVFNLGTGCGSSVKTVVEILTRILNFGGRIVIDRDKLRPNEKRYVVADIGQLTEATGWTPRIMIEQGLEETVLFEQGVPNARQ